LDLFWKQVFSYTINNYYIWFSPPKTAKASGGGLIAAQQQTRFLPPKSQMSIRLKLKNETAALLVQTARRSALFFTKTFFVTLKDIHLSKLLFKTKRFSAFFTYSSRKKTKRAISRMFLRVLVQRAKQGATTFNTTTFSVMTLSITTISITTFRVKTLSIMTLIINDTQHNDTQHNDTQHNNSA
jgi:hypothetical protein